MAAYSMVSIDRASLAMKHLTETLLWLNHEPDIPIRAEKVDLSELIRELAGEMTYLLAGTTSRASRQESIGSLW
ncbi:hypothetical protein [Marinobacter sp. S6332]|uniref:hypothetical protein n=1 Tax=Marinobacter sp. S6332 TaxID=2926403 RepID=UPI001FF43318|nr:hypothetical protein [Marinobacter sp. S6332]MCK0163258.1 hypothetical protein [Marinobacter sp. S6332]